MPTPAGRVTAGAKIRCCEAPDVFGKHGDGLFEWSSSWLFGNTGRSDLGGYSSSDNSWPVFLEKKTVNSGGQPE